MLTFNLTCRRVLVGSNRRSSNRDFCTLDQQQRSLRACPQSFSAGGRAVPNFTHFWGPPNPNLLSTVFNGRESECFLSLAHCCPTFEVSLDLPGAFPAPVWTTLARFFRPWSTPLSGCTSALKVDLEVPPLFCQLFSTVLSGT